MINIRRRISFGVVAPLIIISFISLMGCTSREDMKEEREAQTFAAIAKANDALAEAEQAMKDAGVYIDFKTLGGLESIADLRTVLPEPAKISQLEKQTSIEKAIEAFYETLDALEKPATPSIFAAPFEGFEGVFEISKTDLMMIHFHIAYLYVLAAVSRLARTGGDLFFIDFHKELNVEDVEVYKFELTPKGEELVESIDSKKDPVGVIKIFNEEQRQAVIDSLALLTGAEVVILENPQAGVKAQGPHRFRSNALAHLQKALEIGATLSPEIKDALDEFDKVVTEKFSKEMLEDVKEFGFEILEVPERFQGLIK